MLKNIFFLSLLLIGSTIASASCISDEEYKRVLAGLPSKGDFYSDVPNMVNCKVKSELSDLVCSDPKLKNAMLLLSIGFIYAYENATHTPVEDYSTYNNDFRDKLTANGLMISGLSPDGRIVEMIELPSHPFFVATQAHPEFKSRPNRPHPLFKGFVEAAIKAKKNL